MALQLPSLRRAMVCRGKNEDEKGDEDESEAGDAQPSLVDEQTIVRRGDAEGEQPSSDADDAAEASLDLDSDSMCDQALNSRDAADGTLSMTELVRIQSTCIGSNNCLILF